MIKFSVSKVAAWCGKLYDEIQEQLWGAPCEYILVTAAVSYSLATDMAARLRHDLQKPVRLVMADPANEYLEADDGETLDLADGKMVMFGLKTTGFFGKGGYDMLVFKKN